MFYSVMMIPNLVITHSKKHKVDLIKYLIDLRIFFLLTSSLCQLYFMIPKRVVGDWGTNLQFLWCCDYKAGILSHELSYGKGTIYSIYIIIYTCTVFDCWFHTCHIFIHIAQLLTLRNIFRRILFGWWFEPPTKLFVASHTPPARWSITPRSYWPSPP